MGRGDTTSLLAGCPRHPPSLCARCEESREHRRARRGDREDVEGAGGPDHHATGGRRVDEAEHEDPPQHDEPAQGGERGAGEHVAGESPWGRRRRLVASAPMRGPRALRSASTSKGSRRGRLAPKPHDASFGREWDADVLATNLWVGDVLWSRDDHIVLFPGSPTSMGRGDG